MVRRIYRRWHLSLKLLAKEALEGSTVLCEFLDTLMEFIERARILEELPSESRLIVDIGHLFQRVSVCGRCRIKFLRYGLRRVLQLFKKRRCDAGEMKRTLERHNQIVSHR